MSQRVPAKDQGAKSQTPNAGRGSPRKKTKGPSGQGQGQRLIPFEEIRTAASHPAAKKRKKCRDCHYCQGCSRDRCRLCRSGRKPSRVKLCQAEQIALFERINRPKRSKPPGPGRQ